MNYRNLHCTCVFFLFSLVWTAIGHSSEKSHYAKIRLEELTGIYKLHCETPSDINEHLFYLHQYATQCTSVVEIGVRSVVSTWALVKGLAEAPTSKTSYLGIDLDSPPLHLWNKVRLLAEANNVSVQFWKVNDMAINIPTVDMLFIDSLHTYCHLTYELEKFSPQVRKFIAMHDTSEPWGAIDDTEYTGNYSEYDPSIDRSKRGLWPAVTDFLNKHPEWRLALRQENNHGLTVLERR